MTTTLYGLKNCDSCKKARAWLDGHGARYRFHDFRLDGLDAGLLNRMARQLGWEAMLNRRGTTWRQISASVSSDLTADLALDLMLQHPALIKRPVLCHDDRWLLGFSADRYSEVL